MITKKEGYDVWVRERGSVLEIQFYPLEGTEGKVHYEYYINYNGDLMLLPNRTDFNADEGGQILEIWEQRTQNNWRASFRQ